MATRARLTLALAFIVATLSIVGREWLWVALVLALLAVFLVFWAQEQRATETFTKNIPWVGPRLLKGLQHIDLLLVPQDRQYNQYIRETIEGYEAELRAALRVLHRTRNTSKVTSVHLNRFVSDGLIEYPKDGPGWLKPELRDIVGRTLDDLGA
jgi:hypothetical protein